MPAFFRISDFRKSAGGWQMKHIDRTDRNADPTLIAFRHVYYRRHSLSPACKLFTRGKALHELRILLQSLRCGGKFHKAEWLCQPPKCNALRWRSPDYAPPTVIHRSNGRCTKNPWRGSGKGNGGGDRVHIIPRLPVDVQSSELIQWLHVRQQPAKL